MKLQACLLPLGKGIPDADLVGLSNMVRCLGGLTRVGALFGLLTLRPH